MSVAVVTIGIVVAVVTASAVTDAQQPLVCYRDLSVMIVLESTVHACRQLKVWAWPLSPLLLRCRQQRCCSGFADQRRPGLASRNVLEVASNDNNPSTSTVHPVNDPLLPCLPTHMHAHALSDHCCLASRHACMHRPSVETCVHDWLTLQLKSAEHAVASGSFVM